MAGAGVFDGTSSWGVFLGISCIDNCPSIILDYYIFNLMSIIMCRRNWRAVPVPEYLAVMIAKEPKTWGLVPCAGGYRLKQRVLRTRHAQAQTYSRAFFSRAANEGYSELQVLMEPSSDGDVYTLVQQWLDHYRKQAKVAIMMSVVVDQPAVHGLRVFLDFWGIRGLVDEDSLYRAWQRSAERQSLL